MFRHSGGLPASIPDYHHITDTAEKIDYAKDCAGFLELAYLLCLALR